jgi:hypothetical protein
MHGMCSAMSRYVKLFFLQMRAYILQVCKMVFIGKNLDKDALRKGLEAARAK